MDSFIADYPGVIYLIGLGLVLCIIYLYKKAEKAEKSAILLEISKAVQAIEGMAAQVTVLFKKDSNRRSEVMELSERLGKQEAKCDERTFFQCVNRRTANAPDSPRRRDSDSED